MLYILWLCIWVQRNYSVKYFQCALFFKIICFYLASVHIKYNALLLNEWCVVARAKCKTDCVFHLLPFKNKMYLFIYLLFHVQYLACIFVVTDIITISSSSHVFPTSMDNHASQLVCLLNSLLNFFSGILQDYLILHPLCCIYFC